MKPITFLSDYGPGDEYVGVVEGVIARIAPQARVIHLGHGVPPQDIRTGSSRLARALSYTPQGVHLAVVDPGVGNGPQAVAVRAPERILVGPDNGLLFPAAGKITKRSRSATRPTGCEPSRRRSTAVTSSPPWRRTRERGEVRQGRSDN